METSEFKKIIREEIKAILKEDRPNWQIVGIIMSEVNKSKKLSVNTVRNELWFTNRETGETLKTKII